jgi:hypothetical protein
MLTSSRAWTSFGLVNPSLVQMKYMPTIIVIIEGNLHSGIVVLMPWHSEKIIDRSRGW